MSNQAEDSKEVDSSTTNVKETVIEVDLQDPLKWQTIVSPLICFETEYDFYVKDSTTAKCVTTQLTAKASYNPHGKDSKILHNSNSYCEEEPKFMNQVSLQSNYAHL